MPVIGQVGRRSPGVRFLNAFIHLLLAVGAVTMIYPLLLVLGGSVRSNVDSSELNPVPDYLFSDRAMFRNYIEAKYNENLALAAMCHGQDYYSFKDVLPPPVVRKQSVADWRGFLRDRVLSPTQYALGFAAGRGVKPRQQRKYVAGLERRFQGDITALNREFRTYFTTWWQLGVSSEDYFRRDLSLMLPPLMRDFEHYKESQPESDRIVFCMQTLFTDGLLKTRYSNRIDRLNTALGTSYLSYRQVTLPESCPPEGSPLRPAWEEFARTMVNLQYVRLDAGAAPAWRAFLAGRYRDIATFNKRLGTNHTSFDAVPLPDMPPNRGELFSDWESFVSREARTEQLRLVGPEFDFRRMLHAKYVTIDALNQAHEYGFPGFESIPLGTEPPAGNRVQRADWLAFVRATVPVEELVLAGAAAADYERHLVKLYAGGIDPSADPRPFLDGVNQAYGTDYKHVSDIMMPRPPLHALGARARADWEHFVKEDADTNYYRIDSEAYAKQWHAFLRSKYGDVGKLNTAWGLLLTSFDQVVPPQLENDWAWMTAQRRQVRQEFLGRNFRVVLDFLLFNGRGFANTFIYCLLSVLTVLTVNPVAAYAMSRYRMPSAYKILLFCMLTMAFPPIVLGIPNFLQLKELGLLNTFWALVLPGMANGYSIFLLKGFFDTLPQELFESARIDGAGEWTMFWRITMSLSKPILAVIALNGFTAAYSNFMFAFLVCQDERMWTLMVWLYQLQTMSSQPVVFASIVLAALPPLLIFVFCQNIIMRGIVVPVEK
jgi:ABC-type glycerol-3-phosphate transport system permease component